MSFYLGISVGGQNPGACIIKNNEIIAAAEEERFNRIRYSDGMVPLNAVKFCLDYAKTTIDNVSVAVTYKPELYTKFSCLINSENIDILISNLTAKKKMINKVNTIKNKFGDFDVEFIQHHICHNYSSFPFSGMDDGITISIDGSGEHDSMMIAEFNKDGMFKIIKDFSLPSSLGFFYSHVTGWLGFVFGHGEGKTMGLASYGTPNLDFSDIIKSDGKTFWTMDRTGKALYKKLGPARKSHESILQIHKDVAATAQKELEGCIIKIVKEYASGKNLCLSGGSALNCSTNGKITESGIIKDIFIQPAFNDAGNAIGAAAFLAMRDGNRFKKMVNAYFGPSFSNSEIKKHLNDSKLNINKISNIEKTTAELIYEGKIIGWFQDKMEIGPRALGNRSILADPSKAKMKDIINNNVKHRENWRPFCPSILDENRSEYFTVDYESPFMIQCFNVKKTMKEKIIATIHVDCTARPQTVTKQSNQRYYNLLKKFENISGIPALLNTSFNDKGEPIVCTPKDALRCFYGTGIDYLVIGDYLIQKNESNA